MKKLILSALFAIAVLPAMSFAQSEADTTRKTIAEMEAAGIADPGQDPQKLNALAYVEMYENSNVSKALQLLHWDLILFPDFAADLNDSLAEAYLQAGDIPKAISHSEKALAIKPQMASVTAPLIKSLKTNPGSLKDAQAKARAAYIKMVKGN